MAKNEVAKKASSAVAVPEVFTSHVGLGTDEIKGSDIKFPMVKLLQKLSPQVDDSDDRFIEGAKAGSFLNTDSKDIFTEGFDFLPCAFVPTYIEWIKRDAGGGIAGVYSYNEGLQREKEVLPENNELVLYHNFFGFILDIKEKRYTPAIVSLTSTGFTASRELNYKIKMQEGKGLPIFANFYHFGSVSAENKKGKFFKWTVQLLGQINELWSEDWQSTLYAEAVDLAKSAAGLSKRVDYSAARDDGDVVETGEKINPEDRVM